MSTKTKTPSGGGMTAMVRSPEAVDRVLVGVCAVIWLAVLGVSVAATVVLADIGGGDASSGEEQSTPWLLYTVIAVSALVIAGSIPLLLRARNGAAAPRRPDPQAVAGPGASTRAPEPATERMRAVGVATPTRTRSAASVLAPPRGGSAQVVDRIVLRCTVFLVGAIGLGFVVVAAATYLMGVDKYTAAWVALGLAGVITLAMPVIPFLYLGKLRAVTDALGIAD